MTAWDPIDILPEDIERPGPCLYPGCGRTEMLRPGRPGGIAVYCAAHAAYLLAHPDEAQALVR